MSEVRAWISYGLGGSLWDPPSGERQLVTRCKAIGINVMSSPYYWDDFDQVISEILASPKDAKIIVGGDSLGANEAPAIAKSLTYSRHIDLLFGFQSSEYGVQVDIPPNVLKAVCVYNPIWLETIGLGDDPWRLAAGNKTTKLIPPIPIEAAHPDDFGIAQDIIFNYIKQVKGT